MRRRRVYPEKIVIGAHFRDPIRDAEHFCATILESEWEARNHWEPAVEWEDALQEMMLRLIRLAQKFDPERRQQ